ncbi:RING-type E3 ubiquitin transferase [Ranunculus cassubicifolius]
MAMESSSRFIWIASIESDLIFSKDHVENVHTESEGRLKIYITSAREWEIYENLSPVSLGKIQSPVAEIYSAEIDFFKLLDPSTRIIPNLESVLEKLINIFDLEIIELSNLKSDISLVIEKSVEDIEKQSATKFEIQIFVEILETEEVSSEIEFEEKYGKLFEGVSENALLRMKKFDNWKEDKDNSMKASSCKVCGFDLYYGVEVVMMPCGDMFHKKCIGRWLKQRNNKCLNCDWSFNGNNDCYSSSVEQRLRKLKMVMS